FSFAEFGMFAAMTYSLYKPFIDNDRVRIAGIYQFFHKIYRYMAYAMLAIGVATIFLLRYIVNSEIPLNEVIFYYVIYLLSTVIYNMFIFRSYIFIADQKKYIFSYAMMVFDCGSLSAGVVILYLTGNYALFLSNIIVRNVGISLYLNYKVKKEYPYVNDYGEIDKEEKRGIVANIKDLFIFKLSGTILNSTDNIFISTLIGTVYVGYYSSYQLIVAGVTALVDSFFEALEASVGNMLVANDNTANQRIYMIINRLGMIIIGFCSICLLVLIQDFIGLWMGKDICLDMRIVYIIIINFFLSKARSTADIFREAAGVFDRIKPAVIIKAILNIILSTVLGIYFGMQGILIATGISILVTTQWYTPVLIKDRFEHNFLWKDLQLQISGVLTALLGAFLISEVMKHVDGSEWHYFFLKALLCAVLTGAYYLIYLLLHVEERQAVWNLLKNYVNSLKN
ncbi:MAG: hypothetical protein K6G65_02440, partial [Lachnospiraceae bacterium]|nr:hypothetical protein [Lachnospiraceae bacterium]